jgi:hypothetical protein
MNGSLYQGWPLQEISTSLLLICWDSERLTLPTHGIGSQYHKIHWKLHQTSSTTIEGMHKVIQELNPIFPSNNTFSTHQQRAFDIILQHFQAREPKEPLKMIIQGTAGTGKSYLIHCIKEALSSQATSGHSPILLLAPTGVATFNIHATTIHAGLRIPIKDMRPLHGQSLTVFQEEMKHIHYILIDEMSFIGSRLFVQIESRLREAFPERNHCSFGYRSIILVGDLGQLPPVMDKPLYAGTTPGRSLWTTFTTVIKLETIF